MMPIANDFAVAQPGHRRKGSVERPGFSEQVRLVQQEFRGANAYASEYQGNTPQAHFFKTRLKRIGELLNDLTTGRVLDVGCGPAIIGHLFRGRSLQYYGVDVSEDMIGECLNTFGDDPQFHFSLGRIEELKFPDSYFDAVLCLGAFEYLLDGRAAMKGIARVTKMNGTVIVTMHNQLSPYTVLDYGYGRLRNIASKLKSITKERRHEQRARASERPLFRVYSEKELRNLFASEGLGVEDVLYYNFNVFFAPLGALFPSASVHVSRKLEFLCRSKLKRLGTGFIIRGTRR